MQLKALSIKQPYVDQIILGEKTVEYRTWNTKYRGDILICSTAKPLNQGLYKNGFALCVVELYKIVETETWYEWHLKNVRRIKPIKIKGKLGLFDVTDCLIEY